MKKIFMLFAMAAGLVSCGNKEMDGPAVNVQSTSDRVEVIYFYGKQRCVTCMAIETNTKEVLESEFANKLKDGSVVFKTVDTSTADGEKIADMYEVTWSSLFVNKWEGGNEHRNNMTEFGFSNARHNPDGFQKGLSEKIHQLLK